MYDDNYDAERAIKKARLAIDEADEFGIDSDEAMEEGVTLNLKAIKFANRALLALEAGGDLHFGDLGDIARKFVEMVEKLDETF